MLDHFETIFPDLNQPKKKKKKKRKKKIRRKIEEVHEKPEFQFYRKKISFMIKIPNFFFLQAHYFEIVNFMGNEKFWNKGLFIINNHFQPNLLHKIKIVYLKFKYAEFDADVHFFCFGCEIYFFGRFCLKNQNCLF